MKEGGSQEDQWVKGGCCERAWELGAPCRDGGSQEEEDWDPKEESLGEIFEESAPQSTSGSAPTVSPVTCLRVWSLKQPRTISRASSIITGAGLGG